MTVVKQSKTEQASFLVCLPSSSSTEDVDVWEPQDKKGSRQKGASGSETAPASQERKSSDKEGKTEGHPTMKPFTDEDVEYYLQTKVRLCPCVFSLPPEPGMILKYPELKDRMLS